MRGKPVPQWLKRAAVEQVWEGRPRAAVARELGLSETAVSNWVGDAERALKRTDASEWEEETFAFRGFWRTRRWILDFLCAGSAQAPLSPDPLRLPAPAGSAPVPLTPVVPLSTIPRQVAGEQA